MILPTIAWLSIICMFASCIAATGIVYFFGRNEDGEQSKSLYVFAALSVVLAWAAYESFPFNFGGV